MYGGRTSWPSSLPTSTSSSARTTSYSNLPWPGRRDGSPGSPTRSRPRAYASITRGRPEPRARFRVAVGNLGTVLMGAPRVDSAMGGAFLGAPPRSDADYGVLFI